MVIFLICVNAVSATCHKNENIFKQLNDQIANATTEKAEQRSSLNLYTLVHSAVKYFNAHKWETSKA